MPTRIPPDLPCGGRQYHEKSSPPEIWRRKGAEKSDLPVSRIAKKSSLKFLIGPCSKITYKINMFVLDAFAGSVES
jgi:hypothetical protein